MCRKRVRCEDVRRQENNRLSHIYGIFMAHIYRCKEALPMVAHACQQATNIDDALIFFFSFPFTFAIEAVTKGQVRRLSRRETLDVEEIFLDCLYLSN